MNAKSFTEAVSWVATIVAFIFACLGIFSQPARLETPRPRVPDESAGAGTASGPKFSQLWDDPFAVFKSDSTLPPRPVPERRTEPTLVLVVLSRTTTYQEDAETRLRNRYAIQCAMRDLGYISETPGELSLTQIRGAASSGESAAPGTRPTAISVPLESFRLRALDVEPAKPEAPPFRYAKVVWIPERLLAPADLRNVPEFLEAQKALIAPGHEKVEFCVLGPTSSDSLAQLCAKPVDRGAGSGGYTRILNYRATASSPLVQLFALQEESSDNYYRLNRDEIVKEINERSRLAATVVDSTSSLNSPTKRTGSAQGSAEGDREERAANHLISALGIPIERVGADDFDLSHELIEEIDRRTKTTGLAKRRVILIAEWDTLYGRAAAVAFQLAAAGVYKKKDLVKQALASPTPQNFSLDHFSYMRGLDGLATLHGKNYADPSAIAKRPSGVEPAEGTPQFDYIRRLSDFLGEVSNPLAPAYKDPAAIVILGTDVYDKLTILKLLRERFRQSLFLTTDLDALYWHPEYLSLTRNLIVASPFSIEIADFRGVSKKAGSSNVDPRSERDVGRRRIRRVVFRDSYQTALYHAVWFALERKGVREWATTAKLYEVGNTQAFRLDPSSWMLAKTAGPAYFEEYLQGVNPGPSLLLQSLLVVVALLYLWRIRQVKIDQCRVPREFYNNLKLDAPDSLDPVIDRFARITDKLIVSNSGLILTKKELRQLRTTTERLAGSLAEQRAGEPILAALRAAVGGLVKGLKSVEAKPGWYSWLLPHHRREIAPAKIVDIVKPVLEKAATSDGRAELTIFSNYTRSKAWFKNWLYVAVLVAAIVLLAFHLFYNPDFEGLVGPELRNPIWRWYRVVVALLGLGLIVAVVVWICSEQLKCRDLIRNLLASIGHRTALTDRQILIVVASKSDVIARLSWLPCILLFLLYVAHMRVFVGPPFTLGHLVLLAGSLVAVLLAFDALRAEAAKAKDAVVRQYEQEILTATRLEARLASVVSEDAVVPENLNTTAALLNKFAAQNSTSNLTKPSLTAADLLKSETRKSMAAYLQATIKRNKETLALVGELKSGALAPLALSPILGALILPIAGGGGLTLLELLVRTVR
jgi:hypothetical protein